MKKLITFRTLKELCVFRYDGECEKIDNPTFVCNAKTCPVWKKLKEVGK